MFYTDLKIFQHFKSEGYTLSHFLKHDLDIAVLYECSLVEPPIIKLTSFTKEFEE